VTLTGVVTPWMLLALAFALGIATALNDPAWHAVVPELLPNEELAAGVTLSGVGVNVARTVGPALEASSSRPRGRPRLRDRRAVVPRHRRRAPFVAPRATPVRPPAERMIGAIRAGLRFARNSQPLRRVLLANLPLHAVRSGNHGADCPSSGARPGHGAVGFGLLLGSLGVER